MGTFIYATTMCRPKYSYVYQNTTATLASNISAMKCMADFVHPSIPIAVQFVLKRRLTVTVQSRQTWDGHRLWNFTRCVPTAVFDNTPMRWLFWGGDATQFAQFVWLASCTMGLFWSGNLVISFVRFGVNRESISNGDIYCRTADRIRNGCRMNWRMGLVFNSGDRRNGSFGLASTVESTQEVGSWKFFFEIPECRSGLRTCL